MRRELRERSNGCLNSRKKKKKTIHTRKNNLAGINYLPIKHDGTNRRGVLRKGSRKGQKVGKSTKATYGVQREKI